MPIMRSAGLCKATAPKWQFGVHFGDGGLRIIPAQRSGDQLRWIACLTAFSWMVIGLRNAIFDLLVFPTRANECGVRKTHMTDHLYTFNKSPEQLRRLGARGGRAYGYNQKVRRPRLPTSLPTAPIPVAPRETTAEAIAVLDAQFPWLRGAEKRRSWSLSVH